MSGLLRILGSFGAAAIILYVQDKIQKWICAPRSLVFWRLESVYGLLFSYYFFAFIFTEPADIGFSAFLGLILLPLPLTFYYHFNESGLTCQRFLFRKFYSWDQVDRVELDAFVSQRYGSEMEYVLVLKDGFRTKVNSYLSTPKGLRVIHRILLQRGVAFERKHGRSIDKLPAEERFFLKHLDRIDAEGNLLPKQRRLSRKRSAKLQRLLLPGERVILAEQVYYLSLLQEHPDCTLAITDKRLTFIDWGHRKYSFTIPIADLQAASVVSKSNGEFVIALDDDRKYRFNASSPWCEVDAAQRRRIVDQLRSMSVNVKE